MIDVETKEKVAKLVAAARDAAYTMIKVNMESAKTKEEAQDQIFVLKVMAARILANDALNAEMGTPMVKAEVYLEKIFEAIYAEICELRNRVADGEYDLVTHSGDKSKEAN